LRFAIAGTRPVWSRFLGAGSFFRPALFTSVITVIAVITVITTTPTHSTLAAEGAEGAHRLALRTCKYDNEAVSLMRYILLLYTFVALALAQTTPSITAITNAALPALDQHVPVRLQPRSMATIWGKNLSPATASTAPPWVTSLGGIELHLVPFRVGCGTNSPPSNCDIVASLIFVSPTQINFLVPDVSPSAYGQQELQLDAVIVVNGQRFDSGVLLYVSPVGDFAVFQVGYDCDFSLSLVQPQSCGYSQTPGQNTLPLGAVTDLAGNQVTSQNPIHQGQVVTLWATGLNSLSTDPRTGLLQQNMPSPITFGVTTSNAGGSTFFTFNWRTQTPLWAGESPQYVGFGSCQEF
jgi:uncharacterized protein (TIGR03437 family)